jgi:hypothetical protein
MSEIPRSEVLVEEAPEENKKIMIRVICAWCNKEMEAREVDGAGMKEGEVTHAICEGCLKKVIQEESGKE